MKLALYLPNLRDKVTVKELGDLTSRAEALDFDSVWCWVLCASRVAARPRPAAATASMARWSLR